MIGHFNQILKDFYQGQNRITHGSTWQGKIGNARTQLESNNTIRYMVGYPKGSLPSFYVLCDSEELMEHTKDWLNCALPRFYCQFSRPCKEAEYDFETVLLKHWPHGFLKVMLWEQDKLQMDVLAFRKFVFQAMDCIQLALDRMLLRYQGSPVISSHSSKPMGVLIKGFMDAYKDNDHRSMVENYELIVNRDDLDRRNKDTLKFMLLETEHSWEQIIKFAHQRNVSARITSSAVNVAIMKAVFFLSVTNIESINSFSINWPLMYEKGVDFLPIFTKHPLFEDEHQWKLWSVLVHLFEIEGGLDIAKSYLDDIWVQTLTQQDTSINVISLDVDSQLDLTTQVYEKKSILFVLNYSQTCHESELMKIYEWVESTPISLKVELKQDFLYHRLWSKLEQNALTQNRMK